MFAEITASISSTTVILLSVALVILVSWLWSALNVPGPWGIPVLGYYPFLRKDFYVQLHELAKQYGEVYVINIAGQNFLYLDSIRAVREAHVNQAECFPSRSNKHGIFQATLGEGLSFIGGELWRVQRKFFVQGMREVGMAPKKSELKGPIEDAILDTLHTFHEKGNEPIELSPVLNKQCSSVILRMVLGDDITDDEQTGLREAYVKILLPMADINLLLVGNIAKYFLLPRVAGYKDMLESTEEMKVLLYKILERHKATFVFDQPPRDLIDIYLRERTLKEEKNDPLAQYLTDTALVSTLIQMYGDGSFSVAMFISSFFLLMSKQPAAQDLVHEEIRRVVGQERLPTWEDRPNLPLTNSVIQECLRMSSFVTVMPDMECTRETTVLGVKVPKGCVTLVNLWALHNIPEAYENPEQFDAERFLPERKAQPVTMFGMGKRACVGENLVMVEIFLFVSSVLQNFKIFPESEEEGGKKETTVGNDLGEAMACRLRLTPRSGSRYAI